MTDPNNSTKQKEEPRKGAKAPTPAKASTSRLRRRWFFIGAILFIIIIMVIFRHVLLPFVIAVIISYVLSPVIEVMQKIRIREKPVPRWIAALVIYLVLFGVAGLFSALAVPRLASELGAMVREVPHMTQQMKKRWIPSVQKMLDNLKPYLSVSEKDKGDFDTAIAEGEKVQPQKGGNEDTLLLRPTDDGGFELEAGNAEIEVEQVSDNAYRVRMMRGIKHAPEAGVVDLNKSIDRGLQDLIDRSQYHVVSALRLGQTLLFGVVNAVFTFFLTLMLGFFIMVDTDRIMDFIKSLVPPHRRTDYDQVLKMVDMGLGGVIRGQLMICLINGVLSGIGFIILGLKYWPVLTLIATVFSLVPIFGVIISSIPAVLIGLAASFWVGLFTLLWIIGIHLIEANFLNPKIMGTAARMHPVLVVFALLAGAHAGGAVGALLGVPAGNIIQNLFLFLQGKLTTEKETGQKEKTVSGETDYG